MDFSRGEENGDFLRYTARSARRLAPHVFFAPILSLAIDFSSTALGFAGRANNKRRSVTINDGGLDFTRF